MVLLLNAFSLNMLDESPCVLTLDTVNGVEAAETVAHATEHGLLVSAVGHQSTADLLSAVCGVKIPAERRNVGLDLLVKVETVYVAQYTGPRLQEGATELPEGAKITWWSVRIS